MTHTALWCPRLQSCEDYLYHNAQPSVEAFTSSRNSQDGLWDYPESHLRHRQEKSPGWSLRPSWSILELIRSAARKNPEDDPVDHPGASSSIQELTGAAARKNHQDDPQDHPGESSSHPRASWSSLQPHPGKILRMILNTILGHPPPILEHPEAHSRRIQEKSPG